MRKQSEESMRREKDMIRKLVAEAPPLTDKQRDTIGDLLRMVKG